MPDRTGYYWLRWDQMEPATQVVYYDAEFCDGTVMFIGDDTTKLVSDMNGAQWGERIEEGTNAV